MWWKKANRFWSVGLTGHINMITIFFLMAMGFVALTLSGCMDPMSNVSDGIEEATDPEQATGLASKRVLSGQWTDPQDIAAICRDIYDQAIKTDTIGSLETVREIVKRLGEAGYASVDSKNQVDMAGADQVLQFCQAADAAHHAKLTIVTVTYTGGFRIFDIQNKDGGIDVVRGYYQYDENGRLQNKSTVSYPASVWEYTKEGYLFLEGEYFSDENYMLTLQDTPEYTAFRVLPLDAQCREWNRQYILPMGYDSNNLFLSNWNEEDLGALDMYDSFDRCYAMLYQQPHPYVPDENLSVGAVYRIPEDIFEGVIFTYFDVDAETVRAKTRYLDSDAAYAYRPRGLYEASYPEIPYPEAVSGVKNPDGTVTLNIHAVYPDEHTAKAFAHQTVIRPLPSGGFQYVSNQMLDREGDYEPWWYAKRLTEEEWRKIYRVE